jgi:putative ABC transport system substrate-binding protein
MMRRREFISLLGGAAAAWPLAARAQQTGSMRRIGVLVGYTENDPTAHPRLAAFQQGLNELGWREGRNIRIDIRFAAADPERMRSYAAELVGMAPERDSCNDDPSHSSPAATNPHHPDRFCDRL